MGAPSLALAWGGGFYEEADADDATCEGDGVPVFDRLRYRRQDGAVFLFAFDLLELNGQDAAARARRRG